MPLFTELEGERDHVW